MAIFFQDNFVEASDTDLPSHTPSTGTSWVALWNTATTCKLTVIASTDTAKANATVANSGVIYKANATPTSADYEVSIKITAGFTGSNRGYLIARMADQENMYALRFTTGGTATRMYKKVAGAWTALGAFLADPAVGDVVKLRIKGSILSYYYNGIQQNIRTDTALSAAGFAGFGMGGGAELASSTDDILNTSAIDDFIAQDLTTTESIEYLTPNGNSVTTGWTGEGGPDYTSVDDAVGSPDDATTKIYTAAANDLFSVTLTNTALSSATISKIRGLARMFALSPVESTMQMYITIGGTNYYSGTLATDSNSQYFDFEYEWALNPATSSAWLVSDLDALIFGIKKIDVDGMRCTQMYLAVEHTVSGTVYTLTCQVTAFTITGQNATLTINRRLTASATAYTITTPTATLSYRRTLVTSVTAYAVTGQNAILSRGYRLAASVTAFTVTGQGSILSHIRTLVASVTSYAVTGIATGIAYVRTLVTSVTNYTITGQTAILTYTPASGVNYTLMCQSTAFTLTVQNANMTHVRTLVASVTSYTITGQNTAISYVRTLVANVTNYITTGIDANFTRNLRLIASVTSYIVTGKNVNLIYTDSSIVYPDLIFLVESGNYAKHLVGNNYLELK